MGHPKYTAEEIAKRGKAIYEQQIRDQVEPDQIGKFIVIDIETGDYEIDEDDLAASMRAYRKKPEGARYGMQIGSPVAGTIGATPQGSVP